jgi:crotonobetainyl-CoA:carnitine CoA-transferase CaiB-like acyl-CoA transferase
MPQASKTLPLAGIRVLDLGRVIAAPWCSQLLGDLGAEIIKVERPGIGDDLRGYGPSFLRNGQGEVTTESGLFLMSNRNKESITIDFSASEGQALIGRLAARSDILLENYKTGDLARYGLDYQSVRAINPEIIYCSITGFGMDGPYAARPGLDSVFQAMSGLMSLTGEIDGPPAKVGTFAIDIVTGVYAAVAIQAALRHREINGGGGQHIDLALMDVGVAFMAHRMAEYLLDGTMPARLGNSSPGTSPAGVFPCRDGEINVQAGAERAWKQLCAELGLEHLPHEPRFLTRLDRLKHDDELRQLLVEQFAKRSVNELWEALLARGVVCAPIYNVAQVFADPQVQARQLRRSVPHRNGSDMPFIANPIRFSETPLERYTPAPTMGADTAEVLSRVLGLTQAEIDELAEARIV